MSSFLDDHDDSFNLDEWKAGKNAAYEEKLLKYVLTYFGAQAKISELKHQCQLVTGMSSLNWEWFISAFPEFPVRLLIRSVPYVHQITVVDLFARFTKTSICKAFDEATSLFGVDPEIDCVAMIFNWPGLGTMAMHNYQTKIGESETKIMRQLYTSKLNFVIEKLSSLLDNIGDTWTEK